MENEKKLLSKQIIFSRNNLSSWLCRFCFLPVFQIRFWQQLLMSHLKKGLFFWDPMEFRGKNLVLLSQFPSSCRKLADISRHIKRHLLQEEVKYSKNVHFTVIHRLWRLFWLHHAGASPQAHCLLLLFEMLLFLLLCSNLNKDTTSKKFYSIKRFYMIL